MNFRTYRVLTFILLSFSVHTSHAAGWRSWFSPLAGIFRSCSSDNIGPEKRILTIPFESSTSAQLNPEKKKSFLSAVISFFIYRFFPISKKECDKQVNIVRADIEKKALESEKEVDEALKPLEERAGELTLLTEINKDKIAEINTAVEKNKEDLEKANSCIKPTIEELTRAQETHAVSVALVQKQGIRLNAVTSENDTLLKKASTQTKLLQNALTSQENDFTQLQEKTKTINKKTQLLYHKIEMAAAALALASKITSRYNRHTLNKKGKLYRDLTQFDALRDQFNRNPQKGAVTHVERDLRQQHNLVLNNQELNFNHPSSPPTTRFLALEKN